MASGLCFISASVASSAKHLFGDTWSSDKALRGRVTRAAKSFNKNIRSLKRSAETNDRRLRTRVDRVLRQNSSNLCAVIIGARMSKQVITWQKVQEIAAELDAWKGPQEPARIFLKAKASGGKRPITMFGLQAKALQWMLLQIIRATCPMPTTEFAAIGKGRNAAIKLIVDDMNATGRRLLLLADVKSFFPSISPEGLVEILPLPLSVIIHSLSLREGELELPTGYSPGEPTLKHIRSGLPQGSLVSPYIAGLVMAKLMVGLPADSVGLTFVDDFAKAGQTADELDAIKCTLLARASELPTGPVAFKRLDIHRVGAKKPIEFLGYRFRLGAKGEVRVTPTDRSIRRWLNSALAKKLRKVPYKHLTKAAYAMALKWRETQAAWDCHKMAQDIFMVQVDGVVAQERTARVNAKYPKPPKVTLAMLKANWPDAKALFEHSSG